MGLDEREKLSLARSIAKSIKADEHRVLEVIKHFDLDFKAYPFSRAGREDFGIRLWLDDRYTWLTNVTILFNYIFRGNLRMFFGD